MTKFENSIDAQIFCALKVAETAQNVLGSYLQPLLMSGPGMGKSTAVELFAKARGYEVVMLRGSSVSPETVHGFDVAPTKIDDGSKTTKHLRPTWFQNVLDNHEKGKKTLLFLDEISGAPEYVQSALLMLVLERKCDTEKLPSDTLVIAASNYAANLNNTFTLLPPMLNRFFVINILPDRKDLIHFLSRYEGSLTGKRTNFEEELKTLVKDMDAQGIDNPSEEFINKLGEHIERAIREETASLCQEGILDFGVSDLKDIYSDVEGKDALPGFVTMRTLNFARDLAISSYLCFGKSGLVSDNFMNQLIGLVGMALSYDKKGELVKTPVAERYYQVLSEVANDIEKMNNTKIPEYQQFYMDIAKKKKFTTADMNLVSSKIEDMLKDSEIKNLDRPIDPEIIEQFSKKTQDTVKTLQATINTSDDENILNNIVSEIIANPENYIGSINEMNIITNFIKSLGNVVNDPSKKYQQTSVDVIKKLKGSVRQYSYGLIIIRKLLLKKDPTIEKLLPQFTLLS